MATAVETPRRRTSGPAHCWRALGRDTGGVAIIEFAMVLPILLAVCFGVLVLADTFAVKRKVAITTRTITDLTTQYSSIDAATMTKLLNASATIVAPYDQTQLGMVISQVDVSAAGVATVAWSRAYRATALTQGSIVVLPATMVAPGNSVIVGQATYTYTPLTKVGFLGPITLADKIYLSPRVSSKITLTN